MKPLEWYNISKTWANKVTVMALVITGTVLINIKTAAKDIDSFQPNRNFHTFDWK